MSIMVLWPTPSIAACIGYCSEVGVQQGDPLSPMFVCLVLHKIVSAIASDENCSSLLFHAWYQDDGVVTGPKHAVSHALSIIQELGPPLGLFINAAKCKIFSLSDLNMFHPEMKRSSVPHLEILGAPIRDAIIWAKFVSQKCAIASKLLSQLEEVGSVDPQVALLLLRQCVGFCKLVHLARSTSPSLITKGLEYFNNDVCHCFALSTAVDTTNSAWKQAQLSLSRGGLGLRRLSEHSSACYIASLSVVGMCTETNQHLLNAINKFNEHVSNEETVTFEAIRETPCCQKVLSNKLEDSLFAQLFF